MFSNILVVISGPSGSGKSTLVSKLLEESPEFVYSVSATTRSPRPGEMNGKDYFFVTPAEFQKMIQNDELLEWAEVYGKYHYGTPRAFILKALENTHVVLDADVQGGLQIMKTFPEALFIFIETDTILTLKERIKNRGEMSDEELEARLSTARVELSFKDRYTHIITNTDINRAFSELKQIIDRRLKSDGDR